MVAADGRLRLTPFDSVGLTQEILFHRLTQAFIDHAAPFRPMGDHRRIAGRDAHALLECGGTDRPTGAANMTDPAMYFKRVGKVRLFHEIEGNSRDQPAHTLFLRMATQMVVETDPRGFEYAGYRHIVDVAHRVDILKARIERGDEAIRFRGQTPSFWFGHVLFFQCAIFYVS